MKKTLLSLLLGVALSQQVSACADIDVDDLYFNLFAQDIITDKAFTPFLYESSPSFYHNEKITVPDENIDDWQAYFDNKLTYEQTKNLVYKATIEDLEDWKSSDSLEKFGIKELDHNFMYDHYTGINYLIEAKYLQPYMHLITRDDWSDVKTVENLNYQKTVADLIKWYKQADDKRIKLRYGYQLVRFHHYNLKFAEAVQAFEEYVEPLNLKTAPYYLALDQYAGALNGLGQKDKANYLFFQVFLHTKKHKDSAFSSMQFSSDNDFNTLLAKAKNDTEKEMVYFLLAYQSFNNQLPMMKKIYALNPNSEVLKVLQARAILQLEWHFLEKYPSNKANKQKDNRLPLKDDDHNSQFVQQLNELQSLTAQLYQMADDKAFWGISLAYLDFLQQKYQSSSERLNQIKTDNKAYQQQISTLKMLNDIVSQPVINKSFEEHLMNEYADIFEWKKNEYGYVQIPSTAEFVMDILANRYFIQGELGKSFLVQNKLSELLSVQDNELTKEVDKFYQKTDKTDFEQQILMRNMDVASPVSLFDFLYGDNAMRNGHFSKALQHYKQVENTDGFVPTTYEYYQDGKEMKSTYMDLKKYDRFNNISNAIFGQNRVENFNGSVSHTMTLPIFIRYFDFIKDKPLMNKVELAEILVKLQEIAKGNDERAGHANQLIGNMIYNTSKLGYFRQLFIANFSNGNYWRYGFYKKQEKPRYYYGRYWNRWEKQIDENAFDKAITYYKKALTLTKDKEQQAIILFQLASAEQGKYYKWEGKQKNTDDEALFKRIKNEKFRTYFNILKKEYADTYTVKQLQSSCSYFKHFMSQ
ncbi:hypothetical protein QJU23_02885 [Pasteurella atlantica]|uniref:Uncharacterized protein n=2 Tax=Pasteurellaceae TaxID=712 RepID=A0ACC6HKH4_9PAST|nr:hypothetical protein [Pasteurella atlantica]MDP8051370.1 hypothetical protein [Pasteurella atlantica]MDP8104750.1 hypothetical protein [Pasteurella atlantica]MDP8148028.1 hypothetical protein [Pasteurella atlantica]